MAATRLRPPEGLEFEAWLVARESALQRTAHLLTGDVHAAQDLVQTTLAKLYLRWDRIRLADNVDAYARTGGEGDDSLLVVALGRPPLTTLRLAATP